MATIWVREFKGGLDARRIPETSAGGTLVRGYDGHIDSGGQFEKRSKFDPAYTLPTGQTKGLAFDSAGIFAFGDGAPPSMPSGVSYQRLQHPDGSTALSRVLSFDLYAGKIYVVGEFADGGRYHFYDGVRVPAWYDGRSRASFNVTGGAVNPATAAVGSFEVTGGTSNPGVNKVSDIKIDGVSIISGAVNHTGNNATTAAAIATAINSHSSSPDYTATSVGQQVIVTAASTGVGVTGKAIVVTAAGDVTTGNSVVMAGGAASTTSTLSDLKVDGVSIINAPVVWATSDTNMAALIAAAINSYTSSPDYTATSSGTTVNIISGTAGSSPNGRSVVLTTAYGLSTDAAPGLALAGGTDATSATAASGSLTVTGGTSSPGVNKLTDLKINGVSIINAAVDHTGNNTTTATAIASAINSHTSTPDYTAVAAGAVVTITAVSTGAAVNGQSIVPTVGGNLTVGNLQAMSGGTAAGPTYVPGTFVKTIGSRMHSVSGANEHFSGIGQPTQWTTDVVGAGFIDMSTYTSGAEVLKALAEYQSWVAVFAERVVQIWAFDSDPTLNKKVQVLRNTGTASPQSVTQFGDNDLFYLDESGVRSIRARDASNAAATTDMGSPIDKLITAKLRSMTTTEREQVVGLINPIDKRFWLVMKDEIYVFTFFEGSKISAWSIYRPFYYVDGVKTTFTIDAAVVFQRRVYLRGGDKIFVYGGLSTGLAKDATPAIAKSPFLDGGSPSVSKKWTGFDAAMRGLWKVSASFRVDETGATVEEEIGRYFNTTYSEPGKPALGESTHIALLFESIGDGEAILSSFAVHYEGDQPDAA